MTGVDPNTKRCHAPIPPIRGLPEHKCGNKTKDPSGKCWRHR